MNVKVNLVKIMLHVETSMINMNVSKKDSKRFELNETLSFDCKFLQSYIYIIFEEFSRI